jgi:hypothetical protein
MKSRYTMFNGKHEIVGFAFVVDGNPAQIEKIFVIGENQGHEEALIRAVCLDADREHKNLRACGIEVDLAPFGFDSTGSRKWVQLPKVVV